MKIYFHGNCQAAALAAMVQEVLPEWEVTAREIHIGEQFADRAAYLQDLQTADAIIAQPVRGDYPGGFERSLEFVQSEAGRDCRIITFPSIYFDGQFPEWSYLRRGGETLPPYRMDYHNLFAFQAARAREDVEAFLGRILSPTFYARELIEGFLERGLVSLEKRERELKIDVTVSDLLRERCRTQQVMSTINHPRRAILAACANRLLRRLQRDEEAPEEGPDYLAFPQIPLLPCVAAFLGSTDIIPRFQVDEETSLHQEAFLRGAYAHYRVLPEAQLELAYRRNRDARLFLTAVASQKKSRFTQKWLHLAAYLNVDPSR